MAKIVAVLRIRGCMETRTNTESALRQNHLTRKNHLILMPEDRSTRGFIILVKDYVTWGGIDLPTVELLLKNRAYLEGGEKLTDAYLSKNSKFKSIPEFAKALFEGTAKLSDVKLLKPLFRLSPARGGFEGIKLQYPKGSLGDRKEKINELILKMI
ncbi:MAG: 50S ribosomal protein L30 [Candidatus Micrarchaeota archaeon]